MINQLVEKIKKTNAPVVVGLDPMLSYIPEHILKKSYDEYGETLKGAAEAVFEYNKGIVDNIYDIVPAVKHLRELLITAMKKDLLLSVTSREVISVRLPQPMR